MTQTPGTTPPDPTQTHDRIGHDDGTGNGPRVQLPGGPPGDMLRAMVANNRRLLDLPPQDTVELGTPDRVEPDQTTDGVDYYFPGPSTVTADATGRQSGWVMTLDGDVVEPDTARAIAAALLAAAATVDPAGGAA